MKILPNGLAVLEGDNWISRWVQEAGGLLHCGYLRDIILPMLKPGDHVVDAGAYIGSYAGPMKDKVGPDGVVVAFEPNKTAFECLAHNCPTALCMNIALGAKRERREYRYDQRNPGASYLVSGDEIEVAPLDEFNLQRCDFMKVDVEGMELDLLTGAQSTLNRCRPRIWMEINHGALARNQVSGAHLVSVIESLGYRVECQPGQALDASQFPQIDILCTPQEQQS